MLYRTTPTKISKNLVIEDQKSEKVKIMTVDLTVVNDHISLGDLFEQIIPELQSRMIKTYDFSRDQYISLTNLNYHLPITCLHPSNLIIFKVSAQVSIHSSSNATSTIISHDIVSQKSETSSHKKERSRERVIFQVIQIVKKWREIHSSKNNLKKLSLQEAAKIVGLPKKSLDDYYYQLRLGQKYEFDFRAHLFDRVGVLRMYLKNLKQSDKLDKNEKHPKKLKILDDFQQIEEIFNRNKQKMMINVYQEMQEQPNDEHMEEPLEQGIKMEYNKEGDKGIKHQFYNQFEYMMNQKDPFLASDYNFKKKGMEEGDLSGDFFF